MRTRLLGGVAALIVAIIGTVLLITYVNGADARAMAGTETQDVYVVQKAIPAGAPSNVVSDSVTKRPLPKVAIPGDALTDLGSINGKVTTVALEPGESLINSRFADPSALATPGRVKVPDGMQEITIKLPIERVAGGAIVAGDTVGVVFTVEGGQSGGTQTQLEFHKVLVTAIQYSSGAFADSGQSSTQPSQGNGSLNSNNANSAAGAGGYLVTLARTSADVEKIVYATLNGQVYLTKEPASAQENNAGPIDKTKVFR